MFFLWSLISWRISSVNPAAPNLDVQWWTSFDFPKNPVLSSIVTICPEFRSSIDGRNCLTVQKCESILILILFSIWSSDRFRMFWLVLISVLLINISTAPNFAVMSCAAYLTLSLEDVSHTTP